MLKSFLQAHFFFELRIAFLRAVCYNNKMYGEMSERFKELVLKNSRFCHCKIVKTLDFIEFFGCSSALCEMAFSQFSRKFLAVFSQFPNVFEPILNWFGDYLGQFNSLRRHIEAVITRLSWKQFGSESPRGFESLCLRQSLGALCSKAFFFWNISMLSP